jgi:CPA2 family monovalent cation:H+ antiporter-2
VHGGSIVQDIVLLYALALVVLLVGGRLRVPATVSLILTGVLAGPGGFGLVGSEATVTTLSEIGIALLLFMVGLDLSFGEVRRLWRSVTVGGGAQMLGTMAVVAPFAVLWLGPRFETTLFVGFFVAISSTSLIVRELMRRNEIHSPHGSLAIGILLLQDLLALVALVLAPVLFGTSGASLGRALLEIVLIALGLAAATRFLLPMLFRMATESGREAFGLMVLVASLGTAWLASVLGLSMTVGAFLAGLVIDESEFSHQIHAEIRPLRDLLTSLFFISVGLLFHPDALIPVLPLMLAVAVGIVVLKVVGAAGALLLASVPLRVAVTTGVGLAQIGEFSLVLGASAVANGAIDPASWQVLLGASVLTMMLTPWLVSVAPVFGGWLAERRRSDRQRPAEAAVELAGHVVILGFGVGGQLIARALHEVQTPCVILELGGIAVREGAAAGYRILYGDATAVEPLKAAGVDRAAAVVAVLSDPGASERAVRAVRALNVRVPVIVRTRYRLEADRMLRAGATLAVAEELEASLEVAAQLLVRLDVPGNVAESLVDEARAAMSAMSARGTTAPPAPSTQVSDAYGETPVTSHQLNASDWAVSRTVGAVDLRHATGATILAVKRGGSTVAPPPVSWAFQSGDTLYLAGDAESLRRARGHLRDGSPGGTIPSPKGIESV